MRERRAKGGRAPWRGPRHRGLGPQPAPLAQRRRPAMRRPDQRYHRCRTMCGVAGCWPRRKWTFRNVGSRPRCPWRHGDRAPRRRGIWSPECLPLKRSMHPWRVPRNRRRRRPAQEPPRLRGARARGVRGPGEVGLCRAAALRQPHPAGRWLRSRHRRRLAYSGAARRAGMCLQCCLLGRCRLRPHCVRKRLHWSPHWSPHVHLPASVPI